MYVIEVLERQASERKFLAYIAVEREESYDYDINGILRRASMRLHYRYLRPEDGANHFERSTVFNACYEPITSEGAVVCLTSLNLSGGAVFLDLPGLEGQHIGTFLMNEIVRWAKQWPDANVWPITLLIGQASADNKERRNRFYEQFGLIFNYNDLSRRSGESRSMKVMDLKESNAWVENIKVISFDAFISRILFEKKNLAFELSCRQRALNELIDEKRRAQRSPFLWLLQQLWWDHKPGFVIVGFSFAITALAWFDPALQANLKKFALAVSIILRG
jgi:GNAT superfamily N-acetyltransferase